MTKQEAIAAMLEGKKITHYYFSKDEFIYLKNGKIHDEKGYNIDSEFWMWRHSKDWQTDWSIYESGCRVVGM